ncbi:MATE family efflux transporter [Dokdonella sp.]|uniref:MATE family efflux transporter n=1 Tax=Dokdonella sp. TaxID=2291710 RepID=UPI001B0CA379|nr:MATE family efflux transporter [Dokdonella sp.]MBO9664121.1 MATE family efflux transporter [Dokdonella sp.]
MRDLTTGSITSHLLRLAAPIAIGMLFQTLYVLVDLYFVAQIGDAAIAGVATAGNVQFVVMALSQVLGVGAMALIAQAVGRKDRADANLVFNQSLLLAALFAVLTLLAGAALVGPYTRALSADEATRAAGATYLYWFLPGMALQFALIAMGSALRGTGLAKPGMIVQVLTVLLNALLAPILTAGWLTGRPYGVAGAALASSISVAVGVVLMAGYFVRMEKYVGFDRSLLRLHLPTWQRILRIGLPPGGEFVIMFLYLGLIYWLIRSFGAHAQAGFGVGSRVMQAIFLPAMAIAFAVAPMAGQNFGAGSLARVRATFRHAALLGSALMLVLTLFCQWKPEVLIHGFTADPEVIQVGAEFLRIIAWNFVAQGLIFSCAGMFQALGNTLPSLYASATRVVLTAVPALWLSSQPGFQLHQLWYLSVATVTLQALLCLWLLRRELQRRESGALVAAAA